MTLEGPLLLDQRPELGLEHDDHAQVALHSAPALDT
jgi:hypothetical protein